MAKTTKESKVKKSSLAAKVKKGLTPSKAKRRGKKMVGNYAPSKC